MRLELIARVVTYADTFKDFENKVRNIEENAGGKLIFIEEAQQLSDFLKHTLGKNHEVYELFKTAKKNLDDVVYGEYEYYTQSDS